jgi:ribose transport system permease protein
MTIGSEENSEQNTAKAEPSLESERDLDDPATDIPTAPDGRGATFLRMPAMASLSNVSLLFLWALMILIFGLLEPNTFLSVRTFRVVLAAEAVTATLALALVLPIAAGVFDLSIAGTMGLAIVLVASGMAKLGLDPITSIVLTLLVGLLVGAVNAFIILKLKVNSFIATLGTGSILLALIQWVTGGKQITAGISDSFKEAGRKTVFTIPLTVYYMLALALVVWYILDSRQFGRYLYATGSNEDAARLAGVRTNRIRTIALLASGVIASVAGILFTMRIGSASLDAGSPFLLPAFASVFLGATQFKEGNVNVPGLLVAIYVLATGIKGIQLMGAPFWVDQFFNGAALIVAVALAVRSGRQRSMI